MSRYLYIATLVIAGEMVFGLPFHTARFFRPTLLQVFDFTNTQLGDLFAVYGITAMLSYFPGGAIADRFSARFLLTASLVATGCGGLYMATIPGAWQMAALYGFWGITTIFLFWGALIRATREWGGQSAQGAAFGILEAGRGAAAALFAVFSVAVLAWYLPDDATLATDMERRAGLQAVILIYSAVAFAAGALAWLVIPGPGEVSAARRNPFANMALVVRRPVVWAQAAIIVCAYCGYKGADYYSLYAVQVLGTDEVQGARLAAYGAYIRPVAALAAGFIADRFGATRSIGLAFVVLAVVYAVLAFSVPAATGLFVIYLNLGISLFAVFALRGIYFALLQETRTPLHVTGAAVGMISLVGYTPEVFFAPIAGRILDATPGAGGHYDLFLFLAAIAACGVVVAAWLLRLKRNKMTGEAVY
ncbi:MAG: MFS transporter [Gammaproteobacteria bacterium]|nr:MFS transporter [Gammaproteobacteria bacterium]MDH3749579.1 MFS transporter [Gammaproteobacteria bacterium]MDH3805936.1 MFS transporter [Gammaproteobacteria bacterium]